MFRQSKLARLIGLVCDVLFVATILYFGFRLDHESRMEQAELQQIEEGWR